VRALGADETVVLSDGEDWGARLAAASGPDGFDVVLDPVWGAPAGAAVAAMAPGGRLVTVGLKAGTEATVGTAILGRGLTVTGFDAYRCNADVWTSAVRQLVDLLVVGKLALPVETIPLSEVATAWERQAGSPRRKLVLVPSQ
jgi:NADPH2:quinone reductase